MTKRVEHVPAREGYDRWASTYDGVDNPLVALDERVVPPLVGDVRGARVLDLACGTGRHSIRLVDAGARVTAADFSRGMLAQARLRLAGRDVAFVEADLTERLPFDDAAFDAVLCCLAVEHVRDLGHVCREVARVLRAGGAFVWSDMHPAMRLRNNQAHFDDPRDGVEVRVEGHAHPVVSYVLAALEAGFRIERLEKHEGDDALVAVSARAAKYVGWPMLFAMRARTPVTA